MRTPNRSEMKSVDLVLSLQLIFITLKKLLMNTELEDIRVFVHDQEKGVL